MSFLLDALGKADEDRRRAEVPELRAYRQREPSLQGSILRLLLLVVLLAAAFALGYFLRPSLESIFTFSEQETATAISEREAGENTPPAESKTVVAAPSTQTSHPGVKLELEVISWSENPQSRFAMINGAVVYEGDTLSSGERLVKIEADAVILQQDGVALRLGM